MDFKQKYLKYKNKYIDLKGGAPELADADLIKIDKYIEYTQTEIRSEPRTIYICTDLLLLIKDGSSADDIMASERNSDFKYTENIVIDDWSLFNNDNLPSILNEIIKYFDYTRRDLHNNDMGKDFYLCAVGLLFDLIWLTILSLIKINIEHIGITKLFELATLIFISQCKNGFVNNLFYLKRFLACFMPIETDAFNLKEHLFKINKLNLQKIIFAIFRETDMTDRDKTNLIGMIVNHTNNSDESSIIGLEMDILNGSKFSKIAIEGEHNIVACTCSKNNDTIEVTMMSSDVIVINNNRDSIDFNTTTFNDFSKIVYKKIEDSQCSVKQTHRLGFIYNGGETIFLPDGHKLISIIQN